MKFGPLIAQAVSMIPIERLFVRPPDNRQRVERLAEILGEARAQPAARPEPPQGEVGARDESSPAIPEPTTAETVRHLRDRLARFLSDFEDDLLDGGRIAGKPCDCLKKHSLKIQDVCLELSSMDRDTAYAEIMNWVASHIAGFERINVASNAPDHYRALVPEVRHFRKYLTGTPSMKTSSREERFRQFAQKRLGGSSAHD